MYKSKLVSVIIPSYNSENTIERCINSVLSQIYKEFEIIVLTILKDESIQNH